MAFNIQDFRSTMRGDGARSALFDVTINFPGIVATTGSAPGFAGGITEQVQFAARSSSLPGDSISSVSVNYFGREIKLAGNRSFPDWSIVVIQDEDFRIRNGFERWMSALNSHVGNLRNPAMKNPSVYQTDCFINQYSKDGIRIKTYKLVGCFPTDVAAVDVDWSNDGIEEFSVTFAYQWWEDAGVLNQPALTTDASSGSSISPGFQGLPGVGTGTVA